MTREQLEHIIRACADITKQYEFVVMGSQAILGAYPNPPDEFTVSMEADVYPLNAPELRDQIDGAIGEFSDFHNVYGYYAEGIDPDLAKLPSDWLTRVNKIQNENTMGYADYCIDVLDLFLAKAVAGRHKDREFCKALLQHGYVDVDAALSKVPLIPLDERGVDTITPRSLVARTRRWAG
ncbi:DUF6036 family nucleotidyltransferase [Roseateles saccharophilus]|uniref:DUF6036 domain-containing protein n=1 Tax=Roseateles saccharophilus TaxID=304 RepID=A0A4R3UB91_ROSSA|nr:DUF6036 family nucleotidyltransferase [Roseateles saccharophilus]TCU84054.1 hypothetical protein EV671_105511 [Roseateles saccharophilus]